MAKSAITFEQKLWGASSYLWIWSIVALSARKNDDFVRFHANQGALIFVATLPLMFIPVLGWFLNILLAIVAIVALINAYQGERWELPVASDLAVKFGGWVVKTLKL